MQIGLLFAYYIHIYISYATYIYIHYWLVKELYAIAQVLQLDLD